MGCKILAFNNELYRRSYSNSAGLMDALMELFNLLEEYAPVWYTEELHNRAVSALQSRIKSAQQ